MTHTYRSYEAGSATGWMISAITLLVAFLAVGSFSIWAFVNYSEQKTNVDGKIALAVAEAKKEQADEDEAKFAEREKEPRREFVGPTEYGRLSFDYPKTWSAYVMNDGADRSRYEAYFHPIVIPPLDQRDARVALRVLILNQDYEDVLNKYDNQVEDGELRSSNIEINGNSGVRLDGAITKDIRGSLVLLRVRDKTVTLQTDADTFRPDFDEVLKTVNLSQ